MATPKRYKLECYLEKPIIVNASEEELIKLAIDKCLSDFVAEHIKIGETIVLLNITPMLEEVSLGEYNECCGLEKYKVDIVGMGLKLVEQSYEQFKEEYKKLVLYLECLKK